MDHITIDQLKKAVTSPAIPAEYDDVIQKAIYEIGLTAGGKLVSPISKDAVATFSAMVDVPDEVDDLASWEVNTFENDSNPEFIAMCEELTNKVNTWIDEI